MSHCVQVVRKGLHSHGSALPEGLQPTLAFLSPELRNSLGNSQEARENWVSGGGREVGGEVRLWEPGRLYRRPRVLLSGVQEAIEAFEWSRDMI